MSVTGFFSVTIRPAFSLTASASPLMTTTPPRRSGLVSVASGAPSGRARLETRPSLSVHSAQ
jgi:hypothetical protein